MEVGSKNSRSHTSLEVAGKNMQPDFEPVFERKFHNYINCIEGVYAHRSERYAAYPYQPMQHLMQDSVSNIS